MSHDGRCRYHLDVLLHYLEVRGNSYMKVRDKKKEGKLSLRIRRIEVSQTTFPKIQK